MTFITTFYLSRILNNKVFLPDGKAVGKVVDMVADINNIRPKVIGVKLRFAGVTNLYDFTNFTIGKKNGQYVIETTELKEVEFDEKSNFYLKKNILDRQLVDIDGRKLVRVNDLRLTVLHGGVFLIAVDVGMEGLLRRLGVAKQLKNILKPFGGNLPSHLILWDDVETVDFGHAGIKLSKKTSNLSKLHPSDLADIIEDLDRNTQIAVFASLDEERAADVLEELEPDAQKALLESMPLEWVADLLEKMPADEVADMLDELRDARAEELLNEMMEEASDEVRELMEYPENVVGSLMTTDFISFNEHNTVQETIDELRKTKPESDTIYYLYIVNDEGKLIAHVSLRDIVVADPQTKLRDIMNTEIIFAFEYDRIDALNEIIAKYNLLAVPVVDEEKTMLGMVIINDVVYNLLRARRKRI